MTHPDLNSIQEYLSVLYGQLLTIPEEELYHDDNDKKWSDQQIMGHLIDSAINNYRRFVISSTEQTLTFDGYDQNAWVNCHQYSHYDWKELLDLWYMINKHMFRLVGNIPLNSFTLNYEQHNYNEYSFIPMKEGVMPSLKLVFIDYYRHMIHHLNQIFEHHNMEIDELDID